MHLNKELSGFIRDILVANLILKKFQILSHSLLFFILASYNFNHIT